MKRILVTGAGGSAGIGFCRCSNGANEKIFLVGTDCNPLTAHFSETDRRFIVPRADSLSYIEVLNKLIHSLDIEMVHPQPDIEVLEISKGKDKLDALTFLPDYKVVSKAQNKFVAYRALEKQGVEVAPSSMINHLEDLERCFDEFGGKVWVRAIKGAGGKGSLLCRDTDIARSWINHWGGWGNFMGSEYLPGKNIGWDSIWEEGELLLYHTKERLEYAMAGSSPSGISGTAGTIVSIDRADVLEIAKDAVLALDPNPNGVYAVDLKENWDGVPCVTEINAGRFLTSSLHFFAITGYNLPYFYVRLAYGESPSFDVDYPKGMCIIRTLDTPPILLKKVDVDRGVGKLNSEGYIDLDSL